MWSNSDTGWAKASYGCVYGPWSQGAAVFTHHTTGFNPELTMKVHVMCWHHQLATYLNGVPCTESDFVYVSAELL